MATTFMIDINPVLNPPPGQPSAAFVPSPANASVGQDILFRNNDETQEHWPVATAVPDLNPKGQRVGWWFDEPISKKLPGEPAPVTKEAITFSAKTAPAGVPYICALHPGEKGTLIVS